MSVQLIKQPVGKLHKDGAVTGIPNLPTPVNIGMDTNEFHKQLVDLHAKKVSIEKAYMAIEHHPDITDKERAKMMANAAYKILDASK